MIDDLLVCPVCLRDLPLDQIRQTGSGKCSSCQCAYYFQGTFDLTPIPPPDEMVRNRWHLWEKLQDNFVASYNIEPEASLSVGERGDARSFADFGDWTGAVLDIGCGPQVLPSYASGYPGRFVGIDPLLGFPDRQFDFVKGLAEFLPFRDATFDRVLYATSLDHLLNPLKSLQDARRVLKPDGQVLIWYGLLADPDRPAPDNIVTKGWKLLRQGRWSEIPGKIRTRASQKQIQPEQPEYLRDLNIPRGALDPFHAYHIEKKTLTSWLRQSRLRPVEWVLYNKETISCFVRVVPE